MTKTLLQITQTILSDINGDDVNSIFDTEEAEQVARKVIDSFDNLVSKSSWLNQRRPIQLVASGDSNFPTYMTLPANVKELVEVNYDVRKTGETRKQFRQMHYYDPDDFLRKTNVRDNTNADTTVITDPSGIEILVLNDQAPTFFTTFDDTTLIFDAHDSVVDTTLQASKTQAIAFTLLTLDLSDSAVPDLPGDTMRLLIEEATARVQWKQREFDDAPSRTEAASQRRTFSRKSWRTNKPTRYPNYGRKSRNANVNLTRDVTFKDS